MRRYPHRSFHMRPQGRGGTNDKRRQAASRNGQGFPYAQIQDLQIHYLTCTVQEIRHSESAGRFFRSAGPVAMFNLSRFSISGGNSSLRKIKLMTRGHSLRSGRAAEFLRRNRSLDRLNISATHGSKEPSRCFNTR